MNKIWKALFTLAVIIMSLLGKPIKANAQESVSQEFKFPVCFPIVFGNGTPPDTTYLPNIQK